jgi:NitT/TauT family transport system substrate-binding protein
MTPAKWRRLQHALARLRFEVRKVKEVFCVAFSQMMMQFSDMNHLSLRRYCWLALAAAIALVSAGCDSGSPPQTRIGFIPWPGYEPLALAEDLNYLKVDRYRFLNYTSSSQVLRAFRNNTIEVAAMTLDEAIELSKDIPDVRVVLVLDTSLGADVVLGRPGITNMADLRGHRVAYEPTALGGFMLARALDAAGLKPSDVTLVPSQLDEHERIFLFGKMDAVVTFEPVRSRLLAKGANILFSSAQIPGEIVDVLVVRRTFLAENSDAVKNILRAVFKAQVYQKISADKADHLSCVRLGLTVEQLRNSYQLMTLADPAENRRLLSGNPPALLETAKKLSAVMLGQGVLERSPDLSQLIDGSALQQLNLEK